MIIDCHGHYTTEPKGLVDWRQRQIRAFSEGRALAPDFAVTDDEIRETIEKNQLRIQRELGFVGCNLNPDPSGGHWTGPPLTDRHWYPLFEKIVELDVPVMVHVSSSCNPNFHATGAHYMNADTTAFMQLIEADLFRDFPT